MTPNQAADIVIRYRPKTLQQFLARCRAVRHCNIGQAIGYIISLANELRQRRKQFGPLKPLYDEAQSIVARKHHK